MLDFFHNIFSRKYYTFSVIIEYKNLKMDQLVQLVCCTGLFMVAGFHWHAFFTVSI